jgi:hypothetical protein
MSVVPDLDWACFSCAAITNLILIFVYFRCLL